MVMGGDARGKVGGEMGVGRRPSRSWVLRVLRLRYLIILLTDFDKILIVLLLYYIIK